MKSIRTRMLTTEVGETRPIASTLPRMAFKRLDEAAEFIGTTKAVLIRRAVCRYLQEMEEKRVGA